MLFIVSQSLFSFYYKQLVRTDIVPDQLAISIAVPIVLLVAISVIEVIFVFAVHRKRSRRRMRIQLARMPIKNFTGDDIFPPDQLEMQLFHSKNATLW